jgi:peptidoglycan/xylan/chitin deacetylase (PgdA/CDA1 family)
MIFTTSWDDGYVQDERLADILDTHKCKGTFYVCPTAQHGQEMLTEEQIHALSMRHEIGAHTMTHPRLTTVPLEQAEKEIRDSKKWIEDVTKQKCTMFCYPEGDCNEQLAQIVQQAGYKGARTVAQYAFTGENPFLLPTSLHVYPFPFRPICNRRCIAPLRQTYPHLRRLGIPLLSSCTWLRLAKNLFTHAHKTNQPWFHLWGHSAEIEKYSMWKHLEKFLQFVGTFEDIEHAPNSALLAT